MQKKQIIGLMSGTSLDGVDAALVIISEADSNLMVELKDFITIKYNTAVRKEILSCCDERTGTVDKICQLNFKLGEIFADAVYRLVNRVGIPTTEVDLIGSHGQTIYHYIQEYHNLKNKMSSSNNPYNSTLQVGAGGVIAERTGITTISNFRIRDIAAGGEGAPLVPYIDYLLYTDDNKNRVMQNIGGIANFTYLPSRGELEDVKGTDTGPGNILIDLVINLLSKGELNFDRNGEWAARGMVSEELLLKLMDHSFIGKTAPKSTGREVFGIEIAKEIIKKGFKAGLKKEDIVATVTAYTARSIIDAYRRFIGERIDQVIVSGGGSYNPVLLNMIQEEVKQVINREAEVITQEDLGFSSEAKEAVAFAILAYQTMKGRPGNVSQVTGAEKRVILGDITPGRNFYNFLRW